MNVKHGKPTAEKEQKDRGESNQLASNRSDAPRWLSYTVILGQSRNLKIFRNPF